jgi:hypothetical protein
MRFDAELPVEIAAIDPQLFLPVVSAERVSLQDSEQMTMINGREKTQKVK